MASEPRTFVYKTVAGCDVRADVYAASPGVQKPALVYIHGGALIMGTRKQIPPKQLVRYLDAGFAVVSIDYRLAPETKLPSIIDDIRDAFRWVARDGPSLLGINPGRIGVAGYSAGGYLTLMTGFAVAPRPKSAPSARAVSAAAPSRHTVKAGETLARLAAVYYGDRNAWKAIFEANRDQLKKPEGLQPGMVIVIPPRGR